MCPLLCRFRSRSYDQGEYRVAQISGDVSLAREVFEEDRITNSETPYCPIPDLDLHLATGHENDVIPLSGIVPIVKDAIADVKEADVGGSHVYGAPIALDVRWE